MTQPSNLTQKRLANEVKDMIKNKMDFAQAIQDETNPFIFYFLLKPADEPYKGGYYIGKIMLPIDYPAKAGDFMMLTPNGRFEIDHKICLTNSGYHNESWTPTWSIRNMIIGFISIFLSDAEHGIAHIKKPHAERKTMAQNSIKFNLEKYKSIFTRFDYFVNEDGSIKSEQQINEIVAPKKKEPKEVELAKKEEPVKEEPVKKEEFVVVDIKKADKKDDKKEEFVFFDGNELVEPAKEIEVKEIKKVKKTKKTEKEAKK
jgi:ubiquitin-conjugating enzyme E2 J2